jgi:hypothetical protein
MMNVSVVVGLDRKLPDLLRACGAQVTSIEVDALKAFAEPAARQPDVIVVDARDRSTMPAELAVIKRQHPATGILVVLPRLSEGTSSSMCGRVQRVRGGSITREELNAALRVCSAASSLAVCRGDVFCRDRCKGE